ncbi:hypothetical protein SVIOM74S_08989 [Streptomyces violarus]
MGRTAGRGVLPGHRAGQGLAAVRLGGDGARDRGEREAGVGETEAQRVQMAHETGVDDGHPLVTGDGGEERLRVGGVRGDPDVEAEDPQPTSIDDPGTGGPVRMAVGNRTHSLGPDASAPVICMVGAPLGGTRRAMSAEAIGCREDRVHRPFSRDHDGGTPA